MECSLEDLFVFFSGAERIPPLGFERHPTLSFVHDSRLASASTCDIQQPFMEQVTQISRRLEMMDLVECNDHSYHGTV